MFTLDTEIPAELAPLAWLLGVWEGTGVIDYRIGDGPQSSHRSAEFGQRVSFSHDGGPYLNYASSAWLLPGEDAEPAAASHEVLAAETGYWRLARPLGDGDPGPAMLPATAPRAFTTAEEVETLRAGDGGFELEVAIVHPDGVAELYLGRAAGPRIDLATDAVVRPAGAKDYSAATRLYGLVEGHLLWAWDIAALGQGLRSHASARLARAE